MQNVAQSSTCFQTRNLKETEKEKVKSDAAQDELSWWLSPHFEWSSGLQLIISSLIWFFLSVCLQ